MLIADIFAHGQSAFVFPFRAVWTVEPENVEKQAAQGVKETPRCAVAVSVPKRRFKRAVERNLIKRRTREAFRLNKQFFANSQTSGHVNLFLIYSSNKILPYSNIVESLLAIFKQITGNEAAA